jgi:hypothetical protein
MAVRLSALRAGRTLPPERFLILISVRNCVDPRDIMRLERLGQLKNLMTSSGIEPATFRPVAYTSILIYVIESFCRICLTRCHRTLCLHLYEKISYENVLTLKAQSLLVVPPGLTLTFTLFCPHSVNICFVRFSEQTAVSCWSV